MHFYFYLFQLTYSVTRPPLWPEGSYEYGLSVPLSRSFLGTGSVVFLELSLAIGANLVLRMTEPDFLKIIFLLQKLGK